MILNREVFATDPESLELLNHGVAEVKQVGFAQDEHLDQSPEVGAASTVEPFMA